MVQLFLHVQLLYLRELSVLVNTELSHFFKLQSLQWYYRYTIFRHFQANGYLGYF